MKVVFGIKQNTPFYVMLIFWEFCKTKKAATSNDSGEGYTLGDH
jgi:hypothetical protein